MNNKMSLEEFYIIKKEIQEKEDNKSKEYLINILLNHDLSDIPFEAWEGFDFGDTKDLDFSKTKANIDFNYFKYSRLGNFRGCNIKNIEKKLDLILPNNFDIETFEKNADFLLLGSYFSKSPE